MQPHGFIPPGRSPDAEKASSPSAAVPARPLRILICDDNVDGANTMAFWLRIERNDVRVAHDGSAALEAAREWAPEVILLDLSLTASMDGCETARRLRLEVGLIDALIVAVTGSGCDEDRKATKEAGFDLHLLKPVDPEVLLEVLARRKSRP